MRHATRDVIVTIFGDAIVPRGGESSQGSIIQLASTLGVTESAARSAIHRLALERRLTSVRRGRQTDYRLDDSRGQPADHSMYRIYLPNTHHFTGEWEHIVLSPEIFPDGSETFTSTVESLVADGFGRIGPRALIRPVHNPYLFLRSDQLIAPHLLCGAYRFTGSHIDHRDAAEIENFIDWVWNMPLLASMFRGFNAEYGALLDHMEKYGIPEPLTAFAVRTCLIHEYRHIVKGSPILPQGLYTRTRERDETRTLVIQLYSLLAEPSEGYLNEYLRCAGNSTAPPARRSFLERFGGLLID